MGIFEELQEIARFRTEVIEKGREVLYTNPDRLSDDDLQALIYTIFEKINELDMSSGYEYHDTGVKCPEGISRARCEQLFVDFLDWYRIIETPSNIVYDEVTKNFPASKYKRILCVGDGMCSHLGRKLAEAGYEVVSVDPDARKEFSGKAKNGKGKLHVTKAQFFRNSEDMQDWADLICGSKITEFVEEVVGAKKPAVFTISDNAEIYQMRFKGRPIYSSSDLDEELRKIKGVTARKIEDEFEDDRISIYVYTPVQRELDR